MLLALLTFPAHGAQLNECRIPDGLADLARDLDDPGNSDLKEAFEKSSPDKITSLGEAWRELQNHDVRLNPDFLKKVANLPPEKQRSIGKKKKSKGSDSIEIKNS